MEGYMEKILSEEQQERKEKFENLFEQFLPVVNLIKSIVNSSEVESDTTDYFKDILEKNEINFKEYYLYNRFLSYINNKEMPDFDLPEMYDTDDRQIESIIIGLAKVFQEQAA